MTNRVAVVTGANKGIGYHIAEQLASSGKFQTVVLACRNQERGKAAAESIGKVIKKMDCACDVTLIPLEVGNSDSHVSFYDAMAAKYGKIDVLVNNAAMAFKDSDPTPFKDQCTPTLDVNFRGTCNLTELLLPLVRKGDDARIVNVASKAGFLSQITDPVLRQQFNDKSLTKERLIELVDEFEADVKTGNHRNKGWGNSNYGMSKLALIAMTKIWAREEAENGIKVNSLCPGYCDTDMSSHRGPRPAAEGAKNAVLCATMDNCPSGEFFEDLKVSKW